MEKENTEKNKEKSILIVEDDSAERELYEEMLKDNLQYTKSKKR